MSSDLSGCILFSLDELLSSQTVLKQMETQNNTIFQTLNVPIFKQNLMNWAASGFIDSTNVYQFPVTTIPSDDGKYSCSDGVNRTVWDYIPFFLGVPIDTFMSTLQAKTSGINLTHSVQENPVVLCIHASRK